MMKRKGINFIEGMLVVGILGILIAIAVPGFIRARENSVLVIITARLSIAAPVCGVLLTGGKPYFLRVPTN